MTIAFGAPLSKTHFDADTDDPSQARAELEAFIDRVNTKLANQTLLVLGDVLDPEHATDSGTDAYVSATNTSVPADGVKRIRDFQSANTTPTPTLDGKTITDRAGNPVYPGAINGPHTVKRNDSADTYLLLDPQTKSLYVYPEYWGAKGDGTDPTATRQAIQAAIDFCEANTEYRIALVGTEYALDDTVTKAQSFTCPIIEGAGYKYTTISYPFGATKPAFLIKGGSGQFCGGYMRGVRFNGDANTIGVEVQGQGGFRVIDSQFDANANGMLLKNADTGEFTEYCVAENCDFTQDCAKTMAYEQVNGDQSFHGSGLFRCTINEDAAATAEQITIGEGCLPYNSPMDFQCWKRTGQPIIQHNGEAKSYVYGRVTTEDFGGVSHNLVGGNGLNWLGSLQAFGEETNTGQAVLCERIQVNADGTTTRYRSPFNISKTATANDTVFPIALAAGEYCLVTVSITATDYQYAEVLVMNRDWSGFSGLGNVVKIATLQNFDDAGYGAPSYSVANGADLQVSNSNFGAATPAMEVGVTMLQAKRSDIFDA